MATAPYLSPPPISTKDTDDYQWKDWFRKVHSFISAPVVSTTVQVTEVAGYISSDGSVGYTGTVTTASLVGKTITIKDGIITGFA